MIRRRRAFFLVEMLAVLLALAVGGTLMAVGLASIQRSHKRVAEFGNRYAAVNDFLRCLSRDMRRAQTANLHDGDKEDLQQILQIGEMPECVSYRFYKRHVERTGFDGDYVAAKRWDAMPAAVRILSGQPVGRDAIVSVTVYWCSANAKDPEPNRRFDVAVRCAGELSNDKDYAETYKTR